LNTFLAELGKRAADRWLTLLVLPGALFLAVSGASVLVLGQERWHDVRALADAVNTVAGASRGTGQALMFVVFLGLGASAVGLAAQALGSVVERLWLTTSHGRASRWVTARRRTRWSAADQRYRMALLRGYAEGSHETTAYELDTLLIARDRICPVNPERPTWMGDRIRATSDRVHLNETGNRFVKGLQSSLRFIVATLLAASERIKFFDLRRSGERDVARYA
jgi:hypothetical protein